MGPPLVRSLRFDVEELKFNFLRAFLKDERDSIESTSTQHTYIIETYIRSGVLSLKVLTFIS